MAVDQDELEQEDEEDEDQRRRRRRGRVRGGPAPLLTRLLRGLLTPALGALSPRRRRRGGRR